MIILASSVFAEDLRVLVEPISSNIYISQAAKFKIYITNNQNVHDTVNIRFDGLYWDIQSSPLYHYFSGIQIKPNETTETIIELNPTNAVGIGRYIIGVDFVSSNTKTKISKGLVVNVIPSFETIGVFNPDVDISTEVPEKMDPRQDINIKVNLKNRNRLDITNLTINLQSKLLNDYIQTTLPPLFQKTEEFTFKIDDLTKPTQDTITITVMKDSEILGVIKRNYQITSYSDITENYEEQSTFLKKVKTITLTNNGNIRDTKIVKYPTPVFRLFEKTIPTSVIIKEIDGEYNQWAITLDPSETTTLTVTSNYRSLFIIILLVICGIIGYFIFRPELVAKKVGTIIATKEGGASEIKILIYVKNRSNSFVQAVNVVDRVPNLVEISSEHTMGTLQPTKILKHEKKGTLMKWDIETLESQEERILSYKIVTKLSILGQFNLPTSIVRFKNKNGSEKIISSNHPKV